MSLSSEAKKRLYESLQQQCLNQKSAEYNKAKKLFMGLTDFDYKPGHRNYTYYKYLISSNGHTDKNDIALLDAYYPEEIYSQYIIRKAGKGYTVIDHPFEVYGISNVHECIDGNQPLCLIIDINARQKSDPDNPELPSLNSEKITCEDLPAIFSVKKGLQKLENYLVQPKENYSEIWLRTFSLEKPVKQESQPINDKNALVKGANLLQVGKIRNGFINFEAQSVKECSICEVKHDKNQHYGFIRKNSHFILKLDERIPKAVSTPHQFPKLPRESINVKEMEDALDAFSDFLSEEPSTTLIRSTVGTGKTKTLRKILASLAQSSTNLPCTIWVSYRKTLSNKSEAKLKELKKFDFKVGQYQNIVADLKIREWDLIIVQVESILRLDFQGGCFCIAILNEANTTMRQMASGVHARESSNAMHDLLNVATHIVAMDAEEIVKLLYDPDKGSEAIRRGLRMLQKVYFGQMDGKQRQDDFANINATWSALDCVIYTSTVEASISFEIFSYFDAVIGITNIVTPVHVEVFAQMLFRIHDCPLRMVFLYHSKKFDIFKEPCRELIRAELLALRPGNLPIRRLSAKYFPEIFCSLIASTGATLELILAEGTKVARKEVSCTIKNIKKKIKGADAELIVNAPDISDIDDIRNWGMNNDDWVKLCDIDFMKRYNNPEPLQYFRRLAYFRRQGSNAKNSIENLKIKEEMQ
ncbi:9962_t:CDS:2 [Gigaspora margarita]|uniref:9962_t:CDS:1 n=1 Tax=Gigaspora margarita TaxID=4874 RepID=A0ABN7WDP6_GIGMA|nr:9962_t:CDS:2 [Gigaspora margarita]